MSANRRDYYKVLGVSKSASADDIRKAYRKLARKYHPDFNSDDKKAEDKFKGISEAYAVLSNDEARKKYDQFGHSGSPGFEGFDFSGFNFNDFSGSFSGGGKKYSSGGIDFGDILGGIFGGRSQKRGAPFGSPFGSGPQKGQDLKYIMNIQFTEAALGTTTQITLDTGNGKKTLKVRIPPGVDDGQTIRLKGKGGPSPTRGPDGDLLIELKVQPDSRFTRKGYDLYCNKKISIGTAVLGGNIEVPTLSGQSVSISIPPGTQGGQQFRVSDKGIQRKNGKHGNLYCTVRLAVPRNIDEESRKLIEDFEKRTETSIDL